LLVVFFFLFHFVRILMAGAERPCQPV
jgi:hypothetical protein